VSKIEEIKQRLELITGGIWEYDKHQEQLLARFGESPDELFLIGELIDRDDADFFIKAKSDIEYLLEKVERYERALEKCRWQRDDFVWKYDGKNLDVERFNCDKEIEEILK
jgi:hypothetical protein